MTTTERNPPTLEELRREYERKRERTSRFHKSPCPVCGIPVTNQAMGRKAHIRAHKKEDTNVTA